MGDRIYSGHGPCWQAAQTLPTFTYQQLADASGQSYQTAMTNVRHWEQTGVAEVCGMDGRRTLYRLTGEEALPDAPRGSGPGSADQRMWVAVRGLATFTPTDLTSHATVGEAVVTKSAALLFCRTLMRGGYLKVVRKAVPGQREATYRLLRNTGPLPPCERRVRVIYDPNIEEIVHMPEVVQ